jgi:outer membrane lipoprotein SlyB
MKTRLAAIAAISALVLLEGCVTQPDGPTVPVMPGKNKSFSEFQRDDADCQGFAQSRVAGDAHRANNRAVTDAIIGTALGAGLGAAVGGGHGAAVGAASGAVFGSAVGANRSVFSQDTIQGRYNIAYAQCMQAHGDQVPYGPEEGPGPRGDDGEYGPPPPPPPPGY